MAGIWGNGEMALPGDPPGELEVVDGHPEGGRIHELMGDTAAFSPQYAPEEMFEIAAKLYKKSRCSAPLPVPLRSSRSRFIHRVPGRDVGAPVDRFGDRPRRLA